MFRSPILYRHYQKGFYVLVKQQIISHAVARVVDKTKLTRDFFYIDRNDKMRNSD